MKQEIYDIFRSIAPGADGGGGEPSAGPWQRCATGSIVLEHGQIIESGTHDQLMEQQGQYHLMFSRQASSYL